MGYSIYEFYDDYVKTSDNWDSFLDSVDKITQDEFGRPNRYLSYFISHIIEKKGDGNFMSGLRDFLGDICENEGDWFAVTLCRDDVEERIASRSNKEKEEE